MNVNYFIKNRGKTMISDMNLLIIHLWSNKIVQDKTIVYIHTYFLILILLFIFILTMRNIGARCFST